MFLGIYNEFSFRHTDLEVPPNLLIKKKKKKLDLWNFSCSKRTQHWEPSKVTESVSESRWKRVEFGSLFPLWCVASVLSFPTVSENTYKDLSRSEVTSGRRFGPTFRNFSDPPPFVNEVTFHSRRNIRRTHLLSWNVTSTICSSAIQSTSLCL